MDEGIIQARHLSLSNKFPLEEIMRYAQGWWPDANGKLLPPGPGALDDIGGYAFEGMSTFSILIMSNLLGRTDISIPGTPKESFVKDDQMRWGFSGMAHYGFIQQRLYEIVTTSNHLPTYKVLWTAHETDAKDNQKRQVYGPQIIGEAMTGQCGAWFGAMLHMMPITKEVEVSDPVAPQKKMKVIRRTPVMFLREHIDPDDPYKVPYMAKPRGPYQFWSEWPDWMEPDLSLFYKKLDEMGARAVAAIREKQKARVAT